MTEKLKFISAQPSDFNYTWEIDVQCNNFREMKISDSYIVLVYVKSELDLKHWKVIENKYKEVKFRYYTGELDTHLYEPIIRPYCLKKFFETEKEDIAYFYLDSDVIFRELPDFSEMLKDDIVYQSDTSSYLDYTYLKLKEAEGKIPEHEVISELAKIGEITVDLIKSYNAKTGGAQYLLKNIDADFWQDVFDKSLAIRKYLYYGSDGVNKKYFNSEPAGFQSWCADMWAVNFSLWKRGIKTDIHKELSFCWTTDSKEKWFAHKLFHNAGACRKGMFDKKSPSWKKISPVSVKDRISVLSAFANFYYVEAIKKVK